MVQAQATFRGMKPLRPALQFALEQTEQLEQATGPLHPGRSHKQVILSAFGNQGDQKLIDQCPGCSRLYDIRLNGR
jgi:hypothetical protein